MWFLDYIGAAVWLIGFVFEVVADQQKSNWLKTNRGKIIDVGLWYYTRHPNYFGEALLWWGIYIITCSIKWGWVTFYAPFLIFATLYWLTGPLLDNKYNGRPDWEEYKAKTNYFFPWFPKKGLDSKKESSK